MKKTRAMLLLATVVSVAVACAAPALASADNWSEEGEELTNPHLQWSSNGAPLAGEASASLAGTVKVSNMAECTTVSGSIALEPGEAAGSASLSPSSCTPVGFLKSLGCTKVTAATVTLPQGYLAGDFSGVRALRLGGASFDFTFEGTGWCPTGGKPVTSSGDVTATPDDSEAIGSLGLSGYVTSSTNVNSTVSGTLSVTPAGKYGLIGTHVIDVEGSVAVVGGFQCPLSGELLLEPGGGGKMMSVQGGACTLSGGWSGSCTSATMSANALPWDVQNEGSTIKISGVSLPVDFTGEMFCPADRTYTGSLTATPDNINAISQASLFGVLNGQGLDRAFYGYLIWSPAVAGRYGL